MLYLAAFAAALLVDTIPVFAPPAWIVLAFMIIHWNLNPWGIIASGALGSVIGRYILTLLHAARVGEDLPQERKRQHLVPWQETRRALLVRQSLRDAVRDFAALKPQRSSLRPAWPA